MESLVIHTEDGDFVATYSEQGLARLNFPETSREQFVSEAASAVRVSEWHDITAKALKEVLHGRVPEKLPPMDLAVGTEFQQSVWQAMRQIKTGQTRSYGEIAAIIGRPKAVRAVGGACGANPIPVLIPCHRVLAAHHRIGGFSGGMDWKRRLLGRERAQYFQ
ncbi:methylated-DNA--[protein]-cysteine S-methyltransferase [Pedosphaera parvula]|uniref:methylated-DNA--[protein]-cysteine S-methyltransferase n=1 Tax=Pedosphaera parvula (strain Ellin514) TaxID=320771 RepID=B9XK26_PEDPL|nr:methylated-DNA--[protein]-cysteine S-methyltransferase [Pedosphaera parvula]EEF59849.1 methylated-DNA/protein-cysteine methyltransferase [Pedosphaera parvula Ellin514]